MKQLSLDTVKKSVLAKGYKWHKDKPMIVGIRTANGMPNVFDDYIVLCIEANNLFKGWMATTEPGVYWLNNPMNVRGTGILVPNQYENCWAFGYHGGGLLKHEALVQVRPITLYRDGNKDSKIDVDTRSLHTGIFGINIHSTGRAGWIAKSIDKWSAGCQVFANHDAFRDFVSLLKATKERTFTYTLILEDDIK